MPTSKVALYGLEPRTAERFKNIFLINFRNKYAITTNNDQHITIIDIDLFDGDYKQFLDQANPCNTIVLTEKNSFPVGFCGLQKPAKINLLAELLDAAAQNKLTPNATDIAGQITSKTRPPTAYVSDSIAISETITRNSELEDFKTLRTLNSSERYRSEEFFLATFLQAYQQAATSDWVELINWNNERFLLSRRFNLLYSDISKHQFRNIAAISIPKSLQGKSQIHPLSKLPADDTLEAMHQQPLARALWKLAYTTSRGRLPQHLSDSESYALEKWPNFTRLPRMKNGMRIAAVWTGNALTPLQVAEQLQIELTEVHAFLVACDALGLLQQERQAPSALRRDKRASSVFHSLLGHLSAAFTQSKRAS